MSEPLEEKLIEEAQSLNEEIEIEIESKLPLEFNVIDLAKIKSKQENTVSRYLEKLIINRGIGPENPGSKEFLNMLKKKDELNIDGESIKYVKREHRISDGGRIDLFLKTDKNEVIIIENKIYSSEHSNQLKRYYTDCKNPHTSVFLVYLTPKGKEPEDKDFITKLSNEKRFAAISYEEDILYFLKKTMESLNVMEGPNEENKKLYRSAILQIEDYIKGFCGIREVHKERKRMNAKKYLEKYRECIYNGNSKEHKYFIDLANTSRTIYQGINSVLRLRFLFDLFYKLRSFNSGWEVVFTHRQSRIDDPEKFYDQILKDPIFAGVEVRFHAYLGFGFEIEKLSRDAQINFGFMSHVQNNNESDKEYENNKQISELLQDGKPTRQFPNSWWWELIQFKPNVAHPWFHRVLINPEDWEKSQLPLHEHVTNYWFKPILDKGDDTIKGLLR